MDAATEDREKLALVGNYGNSYDSSYMLRRDQVT